MPKSPLKSFNIYDIFANIVPGIVFLLGLTFPFKTQQILGNDITSVINVLFFVLISFVVGQVLQLIGGWIDKDHNFSRFIEDIIKKESKSKFNVTGIDRYFIVLCSDTFNLSKNFNNYNHLFKLLLAYLEHSGRSRALRMQALYLFSRGIWVSSWLLFLWFLVLFISLRYGYISADSINLINLKMDDLRGEFVILISLVISFIFGYIFNSVRREIEKDWVMYVVIEFYLDRVTTQQGQQFRQNIQI